MLFLANMNKRIILIQALVLAVFWILYLSLEHQTFYEKTLGQYSDNWQNVNGERSLGNVPYVQPENNRMVQWDARHYELIKDHGYDTEKAGGDFIYAFFPLFPLIWKASLLPPLGVLFLNYFFFSISIFLLLTLFSNEKNVIRDALLSSALPGLIIFLIPYTEATYMLMVSIGIRGFVKKKYWKYFVGLFLAALARPSFTFLLLSLVGVEFILLLQHKNIRTFLKDSFLRALPLICGTALVSVIQFAQGSKTVFKFVQVQKYWDNVFGIPHNIKDWSHEGFGINLGIVIVLFIPMLMLLLQFLLAQLKKSQASEKMDEQKSIRQYLVWLSILYIVGNTLFVILFRGGSLNCLFRFTICSPFIFILIYLGFDYIKHIGVSIRRFFLLTLSALAMLMLGLIDYSTFWNFSDMGMILLLACVALWLFQDQSHSRLYKISLYTTLLFNLLWTTYLFNMYLVDGWIFA